MKLIATWALCLLDVKREEQHLNLQIVEERESKELRRVAGEMNSQGLTAGKLNVRRLSSSELYNIEIFGGFSFSVFFFFLFGTVT